MGHMTWQSPLQEITKATVSHWGGWLAAKHRPQSRTESIRRAYQACLGLQAANSSHTDGRVDAVERARGVDKDAWVKLDKVEVFPIKTEVSDLAGGEKTFGYDRQAQTNSFRTLQAQFK